jgi:hypothetical protein
MTAREALGALLLLAAAAAHAQPAAPVLRYDPPANYYRSAVSPPEDYSANELNASIQVYPFRPVGGDVQAAFRKTLLRDWIDPRYRESNVIGQPAISPAAISGAQTVLIARFAESVVGVPREHMRMLVVAGGMAALVDVNAGTRQSWERAGPAVKATLASMRVEAGKPPPPAAEGPGPAGIAMAGLYRGTKVSPHFYLFTPDGYVYRSYDAPPVPGRNDPENSGRFAVKDGKLHLRMGPQQKETISAAPPQGGRLTLDTVLYVRQ